MAAEMLESEGGGCGSRAESGVRQEGRPGCGP